MRPWTLIRRSFPFVVVTAVVSAALVATSTSGSEPAADEGVTDPATLRELAVPALEEPRPHTESTEDEERDEDAPGAEHGHEHAPGEEEHVEGPVVAELDRTGTKQFSLVGVTWEYDDSAYGVEVAWRTDEGWSQFTELHVDPNDPVEGGRAGTEPQWVEKADGVAVRVVSEDGSTPKDLQVATVDPGRTADIQPVATSLNQPRIIMRSSWGARRSSGCSSSNDRTRGAIVHHTAGSNSYSASQSAGIVKSTQAFHMGSRNWCDIGYNFLVDKYGQIFEGREGGVARQVRGAHAGNWDVNAGTVGVSMMGTFETTNPSSAMKNAVAEVIAWRFSLAGVPATGRHTLGGRTLERIAGHRNVVSTACPGARAYAWLSASGGLRAEVAKRLRNAPSEVSGLGARDVGLNDATLTWRPVSGAARYRVYVRDTASMPSACEPHCEVITPSDLSSPSHRLTGLKDSQTYRFKVSAIDSSGKTMTGWQPEPEVFTTDVGGIKGERVTTESLTLSWKPVADARRYRIYASPSSDMPSRCEPHCEVVTPSDLSDPSHTLSGLEPGSTYHVKISALDSSGRIMTDWQTDPVRIELPDAPKTVQGLTGKASSSTSMTVDWDRYPGAVKYRLYASPSASMPSRCEPYCQVITPSDLDDPSFELTGLKSGGTYRLKMSAINASGKTISSWQTDPVSVKLPAAAPTEVQGIAGKATSGTSLTASWDAFPRAAKYRIYASPSANMPYNCEPYCEVVTPKSSADPQFELTGLDRGATYHLKISAIDASGKTISGWQENPVAVKLPAAAPTEVEGIAGKAESGTSLTASWDAFPRAAKYRIYASPSADMPSRCEPHCQVVTPSKLSDPSFRLTGLTYGGTYYLKISAIDASGKTISGWQDTPVAVKLPKDAPASVQGISGKAVSSSSLTATWDAYPGAAKYRLYASPTQDMPYNCEPYCSVVTPASASTPSHRLSGLIPGSTYHLKVSAISSAGKTMSSWQDAPVAVRLPAPDDVPSTVQGVSASSVSGTSLKASWDPYPGAVEYRVYTSPNASMPGRCEPYCRVVSPSNLNDPSYTVTGLNSGAKYYVKVSAINSAGKTISSWQSSPASVDLPGTPSSSRNSISVSGSSVTFKGHGYGHGIGMSQYGAEGGARAGRTYSQILSTYYPGTALGSKSGDIRVHLTGDTTDSVMIEAGSGIRFRQGSTSFTLPTSVGGRKVIRWSIDPHSSNKRQSALRYRTDSNWKIYENRTWTGEAQFEATTLRLVMPGGANRVYRDTLRSALPKSGATNRDTVNVLSIEDYTRGVVAREMPSSWRPEALKAQSVAARTYGVRSLNSSRYYDICDTTSCQVYGGVSAETSSTDSAISATKGRILTYKGSPALTQFSSSSGGYTNVGSQPYLKPVADPWDDWSGNANHSWNIKVSAKTIQSKYPAIGTLRSLSVTSRNGYGDMGGRVKNLRLVGSKGTKTITGVDARWAFGLKSDWFGF